MTFISDKSVSPNGTYFNVTYFQVSLPQESNILENVADCRNAYLLKIYHHIKLPDADSGLHSHVYYWFCK